MGIICVVYVPLVGIQMADYFFLRKQRINLASTYDKSSSSRYRYWGGFNWVAVFVFLSGAVVYYLIMDPVSLTFSSVFPYVTATGGATIYSLALYYVLGRTVLLKRNKGGYRTEQ